MKRTLPIVLAIALTASACEGPTNRSDVAKVNSDSLMRAANKSYKEGKFDESLQLYKQVAALGNAEADEVIAWMYKRGTGVKKDNVLAAEWFRKRYTR